MKYIIKNCPQCIEYTDGANRFFICQTTNTYCQIVENCLLKQIVELCKIYKNMIATTTEDYARREVALKILDLLDIEEVE